MPGGKYKAARPVPTGWSEGAWLRAYNAANSRILHAEGKVAEAAARESGRTRREAALLKDCYDQVSGRKRKVSTNQPSHSSSSVQPAAANSFQLSSPPALSTEGRDETRTLVTNFSRMAVQSSNYPLTPAQAQQIVSFHEEDNAKINEDLESVRSICTEKCSSNTKKCSEHSKEIRRLWRNYYINFRSGSWASYRSQDYITEMKKLFDGKADIHVIHARAAKEKRLHYKDALCTIRFNDDPMVKTYKEEAAVMYDKNVPETQIREFISKKELEVAEQRSPRQLAYDSRLAACKTDEEKRAVYQEDACTRMDGDTQGMVKLRSKWQGLFEDGLPYVDIYAIIQKDVTDFTRKERHLRENLAGLQSAKAAHDKAEIAKEAKKAAKELAVWTRMLSKYTFHCTTEGCQNLSIPISQDEGNLECCICNCIGRELARDGVHRERSYFCSEECLERYGRTHILKAHPCNAAAACTTGVFNRGVHEKYFGFCGDCWKNFEAVSYFCSEACWNHNYYEHCKHVHTQLRTELIQKLENNKDFFEAWTKKKNWTQAEIQKGMTSANWATESSSLAIRPSHSPN